MSRYTSDTYTVYMHKHKENGKVYIGCTKKPLSHRFENGNGYKKCTRFWEEIQRDGFDAFDHITISSGLSLEEAYNEEDRWIRHYDSMNPEKGYNLRNGGKHNTPCKEVGERISAAKMGHEVSDETREKLKQHFGKKVLQLSLDGEPIRIYDSLTEAANDVGGFKSNIWAVCAGRKPSCKNYKWEYYEEVM